MELGKKGRIGKKRGGEEGEREGSEKERVGGKEVRKERRKKGN